MLDADATALRTWGWIAYRYDIELYRYAQELFEAAPELQELDFEVEVAALRAAKVEGEIDLADAHDT